MLGARSHSLALSARFAPPRSQMVASRASARSTVRVDGSATVTSSRRMESTRRLLRSTCRRLPLSRIQIPSSGNRVVSVMIDPRRASAIGNEENFMLVLNGSAQYRRRGGARGPPRAGLGFAAGRRGRRPCAPGRGRAEHPIRHLRTNDRCRRESNHVGIADRHRIRDATASQPRGRRRGSPRRQNGARDARGAARPAVRARRRTRPQDPVRPRDDAQRRRPTGTSSIRIHRHRRPRRHSRARH